MDDREREPLERHNRDPWDDHSDWPDIPSKDQTATSFCEQLLRGSWPIRIPVTFEIYAEGWLPQVDPFEPGQQRHPDSHIITLVLEYDRARVRELMLKQIREPRAPRDSMLLGLIGLVYVDRQCFLETSAERFAHQLSKTDADLRNDRYLFAFVRELHEADAEVIGDLVAETMRRDRTAGARLRSVILDLVDHPDAREDLGWLAAAAITERLQAL